MNPVIEWAIETVSPTWALKRRAARRSMKILEITESKIRKYDAAGTSQRTSGWGVRGSLDANTENLPALELIRDRGRDLYRNNVWFRRAEKVIENNAIGPGIAAKIEDDKLAALWKEYAHTTACDAHKRMTIVDMDKMALNTAVQAGEVLIRRVITRDKKFPVKMVLLEPDFIDTSHDLMNETDSNGNVITETIQGIMFDKFGSPLGYWLFDSHPGSTGDHSTVSRFVPADEVIHFFIIDRPGQVRGVTQFAPCIQRMRNLDKYEDAELEKQIISSMFAGFITDADCDELNGNTGKEYPVSDHIQPGTLEVLPPGQSIEFADPPSKEGYSEYARQQLLALSACCGITYEALTNDLRQTSFTSGRIGSHEMSRNIAMWQSAIINQIKTRQWEWFLLGVELTEGIPDSVDKTIRWRPPARLIVDTEKETKADRDAVRSGFKSLSDAIRDRGDDPEEVFSEIVKDNKFFDDNKLILDTDPRVTTNNGQIQGEAAPDPAAPKSDKVNE